MQHRFRPWLAAALVLAMATPVHARVPGPAVAFYGSSTTFGVGASRPDRRYSSMVCRLMGWTELNAGLNGATVASEGPDAGEPVAVTRWKKDVVARHPSFIVAMVGANDAARDLPVGPGRGSFRDNMQLLLDALPQDFPHAHLALANAQPSQLALAHRAGFDAALMDVAHRYGATGIPTQDAFPASEIPAMAFDAIHMNDLGHALVASFVANALTDAGWAPHPDAARGGTRIAGQTTVLPGRAWVVADAEPLGAGELTHVEIGLSGPATVRIGVVRPDGHGGFERLYRTAAGSLKGGTSTVPLPRWRVLAGDRLAAWTDRPALLGSNLPPTVWGFRPAKGSALAFRTPTSELQDLGSGSRRAEAASVWLLAD